jgi:alanine racemase
MHNRAQALINLSALKHNLQHVKSLAPQQSVLAMIKANGYGHGLVRVARALNKADAFGIACLDEAAILREHHFSQPLVLMAGVASTIELDRALNFECDIVIHHPSQLKVLQKHVLRNRLRVWLKIDTGMHRLGVAPDQIDSIYKQLQKFPIVKKPLILMTHLASADNLRKKTTQTQVDYFHELTGGLVGDKSIANSAAIMSWPQTLANWVRPGLMLYGMSPFSKADDSLKPVMTLQAKLIAINSLKKGDAVGYGGISTCPEDMSVGVVSIGYGDGYPRSAKPGTPVLINGVCCPLLGRVSMDLISVDLRECPEAKIGDIATLWGNGLPAEEIAEWCDTIPYTLTCGVTQRVHFVET